MSLQQVDLHLDEGHLVLGQDFHQGSVGSRHLTHGGGVVPGGKGCGAVELEAAHVHKGGVHPASSTRATARVQDFFMMGWFLESARVFR